MTIKWSDGKNRCHDKEWGVLLYDDQKLFEMLT